MRRATIQAEDGTILRAYLHSPGPGAHPGIAADDHRRARSMPPSPKSSAVYEAVPEPKKLLTFDGGHFDAYTTFFEQTGPRSATGSPSTSECRGAATQLGRANR